MRGYAPSKDRAASQPCPATRPESPTWLLHRARLDCHVQALQPGCIAGEVGAVELLLAGVLSAESVEAGHRVVVYRHLCLRVGEEGEASVTRGVWNPDADRREATA